MRSRNRFTRRRLSPELRALELSVARRLDLVGDDPIMPFDLMLKHDELDGCDRKLVASLEAILPVRTAEELRGIRTALRGRVGRRKELRRHGVRQACIGLTRRRGGEPSESEAVIAHERAETYAMMDVERLTRQQAAEARLLLADHRRTRWAPRLVEALNHVRRTLRDVRTLQATW